MVFLEAFHADLFLAAGFHGAHNGLSLRNRGDERDVGGYRGAANGGKGESFFGPMAWRVDDQLDFSFANLIQDLRASFLDFPYGLYRNSRQR